MNITILSGHLTRAPELKITPSGAKVCNFGIASNERFLDRETGEQRESVTFVEAECWNKTAESVFEYFKKGDPILIHGSLRFESWESEGGQKRSRLKVRVSRWEFMQRRSDNPTADMEPTDDQNPYLNPPVSDDAS